MVVLIVLIVGAVVAGVEARTIVRAVWVTRHDVSRSQRDSTLQTPVSDPSLLAHGNIWSSPPFRWAIWALLVVTLALLAWLHVRMSVFLDMESLRILDRFQFRFLHSWYLTMTRFSGSQAWSLWPSRCWYGEPKTA